MSEVVIPYPIPTSGIQSQAVTTAKIEDSGVTQGKLKTATNSQTGNTGAQVTIACDPYSFLPNICAEDSNFIVKAEGTGAGAPGSADTPSFDLENPGLPKDYGAYWRSVDS